MADGGKVSDAAMRWTYQTIGYRVVHCQWGAGLRAVQQDGHGYGNPYLHKLAAAPGDGGSDGETVGVPDGASVSRTRHSSSNLISSSSSRSTADVLAYLETVSTQ